MRRAAALATLTVSAAVLAVIAHAQTAPSVRPAPWATLAFARSEVVGGGIVLLGAGRVATEIPSGVQPAWSPDGRRIAYVAPGAAGAGDLFVADADGTNRGRITATPDAEEAFPSWAPDGTRLAVEQGMNVVVLRADGSGTRALGRGATPPGPPAAPGSRSSGTATSSPSRHEEAPRGGSMRPLRRPRASRRGRLTDGASRLSPTRQACPTSASSTSRPGARSR